MKHNGKNSRTALLIRCTEEEAKAIREAAKLQRRTLSAFVLRAVMRRVSVSAALRKRCAIPAERFSGPTRPAPDKLLYSKRSDAGMKSGEVTSNHSSRRCGSRLRNQAKEMKK
ncbi:MAG TPA: DUF1778 domain-containing protein [Terriglobales bacterium]|nr:DUF1778 domain-containing protein [Terriglobales bacterium]